MLYLLIANEELVRNDFQNQNHFSSIQLHLFLTIFVDKLQQSLRIRWNDR